jgi:transcriptional regulator with GAF, ATPase, and Fis domain
MVERALQAKSYFFFSVDQLPAEAEIDKKNYEAVGVKYGLLIPYWVDDQIYGAMAFTITNATAIEQELLKANIEQLRLVGEVIVNALRRKAADQSLKQAFTEINDLKDQLQKENIYLREEIKAIHRPEEIVGESEAMHRVLKNIEEVAQTDATVLILGETGTGKELAARAIHNLSRRQSRTMVTVNCAALSPTLVESELFGRERGAYTGAMTRQVGRFETANGSTLFLDEVGELPLELQVKLLRVLQEGQFERLGSSQTTNVDVRLVAATNRNLEKAVLEGTFREDLYYRLNVFPIRVPPLRERSEDILPLIWHYAKELGKTMGKQFTMISRKNLEEIQRYSWPGNIRELRNVVERAVITSKGNSLQLDVPRTAESVPRHLLSLEEHERRYILEVLEKTRWRISGEAGAAAILDMKPTTLHSRMNKLGIRRSDA